MVGCGSPHLQIFHLTLRDSSVFAVDRLRNGETAFVSDAHFQAFVLNANCERPGPPPGSSLYVRPLSVFAASVATLPPRFKSRFGDIFTF